LALLKRLRGEAAGALLIAVDSRKKQSLFVAESRVEARRIEVHRLCQLTDGGGLIAVTPEELHGAIKRSLTVE
jgi:hypothetical protein